MGLGRQVPLRQVRPLQGRTRERTLPPQPRSDFWRKRVRRDVLPQRTVLQHDGQRQRRIHVQQLREAVQSKFIFTSKGNFYVVLKAKATYFDIKSIRDKL